MSSRPAASIRGATIQSGITADCRTPSASRSADKAPSTRSPPPACSWSARMAGSSPARRSTSMAARIITDLRSGSGERATPITGAGYKIAGPERWADPVPPPAGYSCGAAPSSDLLDQLHLRAVGRGNPAHMPTVVEALFEDLRAILLNVGECAGVIVGLDGDVLDANVLLMVLVGDDRRHVELHAVQVELAAAAGDFPLHSRAEIVDVELRDLLRVLFGLDVDVPELHGHTGLLPRGFTKRRRGDACRSQRRSTRIRTQPAFARFPAFREQDFRPHRCWVTASTNAGLPCLTRATACCSAGCRSSAFSIGPSAHQP